MAFYNCRRVLISISFLIFKTYANSFNELPLEIYHNILEFSSTKTIINIRQVNFLFRYISDINETKTLIKKRLKKRFFDKVQNNEKLKNHFLNEFNKIQISDKYFFQKLDHFYEPYYELECLLEYKKYYDYQPQQPLSYSIYDLIFKHPSLKFNHTTPLFLSNIKYNNIIKEIIYNIIEKLDICAIDKNKYIYGLNEENNIDNLFKAIKLYKKYINSKFFSSFYGIKKLIFIGLQTQNIEVKNIDHIKYIGFQDCAIENLNIQNLDSLEFFCGLYNNIKKLSSQNNISLEYIRYINNTSNFISIQKCPSLIEADLRKNGLSHIKHDNSSDAHIILKGNKSLRLLFHSIGRNKKLCGYVLERIFIDFYKKLKEEVYNWADFE